MNSEDILQLCLEDVAAGRRTPAECAAAHPEVEGLLGELEAAQLLQAWAPPAMAQAAERRHLAHLRALQATQAAPTHRRGVTQPRWALAALLMAALFLIGAGTVVAASNSRPGQVLYPIKRGTEAVQTAFTPAAGQANRHADLSEERTNELLSLPAPLLADEATVQTLAAEMIDETEAALRYVALAPRELQPALLLRILAQIERQQAALAQAQNSLPSQAQAKLEESLAASRAQQETALEILGEIDPAPSGTATATATATPSGTAPPGATATPSGTTIPSATTPPSATATAATATSAPSATPPAVSTTVTPGQGDTATPTTEVEGAHVPPGQAKKTETAAAAATAGATVTAPGNSGSGGPNCHANNPNSHQYCTPTPGA